MAKHLWGVYTLFGRWMASAWSITTPWWMRSVIPTRGFVPRRFGFPNPRMASDRPLDPHLRRLAEDESPDVKIQVILSVVRGGHPQATELADAIVQSNPDNLAITGIAGQVKARLAAMEAERRKLAEMRRRNRVLAESVVRGKAIYNTLCVTCHANNGLGQPSPDDKNLMLAPPLVGFPRVLGHQRTSHADSASRFDRPCG